MAGCPISLNGRPNGLAASIALLLCLIQAGCWVEMSRSDPWADFRKLSNEQEAKKADRDKDRPAIDPALATEGWAILLGEFEGEGAEKQAKALAERIERETPLTQVWIKKWEDRFAVVRGTYYDTNQEIARLDLRQTRMMPLGEERPFEQAVFVPLADGAQASSNRYNLRNYVGSYSLQVGFYDEAFGPEYRKAAEEMARVLREDGDEAYFYHGPNISMVTVGLFTEEDFDYVADAYGTRKQVYGPAIRELQEKYKYNLGNGVTLEEKRNGKVIRTLPSFIVRVPE